MNLDARVKRLEGGSKRLLYRTVRTDDGRTYLEIVNTDRQGQPVVIVRLPDNGREDVPAIRKR